MWQALSELFLDTVLTPGEIEGIARILAASSYETAALQHILYRELFPVLKWNLYAVAGAWAGFDMEALEARILAREDRVLRLPGFLHLGRSMIRQEWDQIKDRVDSLRAQTDHVA